MTITEKIETWSKVFGAPVLDKPTVPSNDRQSLSVRLIDEEFEEFKDALYRDDDGYVDIKEVADALGDTLWVTIRAMMEFGLDPEAVIDEIYKSNMSKICKNKEEAEQTVAEYRERGIAAYYSLVNAPDVPRRAGNNFWVVKRESDDKILKSINWKEPDWSSIKE